MMNALCLLAAIAPFPVLTEGRANVDEKAKPFVLECYYKAKWGQADEFLKLYKKNHLPVMEALRDEGRVLKIEVVKARYHGTEEGRWDYRVTLVFRDALVAHDPEHEEAIKRRLYVDQETFRKEEARRFEVLAGHWDVIVDPVD